MPNGKTNKTDIEIDESALKKAPTIGQKFKTSAIAIVFGALFIQMFILHKVVRSGTNNPGSISILIYFNNYLFWGYLVVCGIFGWLYGRKFTNWLSVKISEWVFW